MLQAWEGKRKCPTMSNHNEPFASLRHIVVHCIQYPVFQHISKFLQSLKDFFEIWPALVKQTSNIFKNENLWIQCFDSINEYRKAVSRIAQPILITNHTKWLARGAADQHSGGSERRFRCEHYVVAFSAKIFPICCATCGVHFVPVGFKAFGFESKRQSSAARKEIYNQWQIGSLWHQCGVYHLRIIAIHVFMPTFWVWRRGAW